MRRWSPEETVGASIAALDKFMRLAQGLLPAAPLVLLLRLSHDGTYYLARSTDDLAEDLRGLELHPDCPLLSIAGRHGPVRVPSAVSVGRHEEDTHDLGRTLNALGIPGLWAVPLGRERSPIGLLVVGDEVGGGSRPEAVGFTGEAALLKVLADIWEHACPLDPVANEVTAVAIAACVADALLVVDRAGRVTFVNDPGLSMLGFARADFPDEVDFAQIEGRLDALRFLDEAGDEFNWITGPLTWALDGEGVKGLELRESSRRPARRLRLTTATVFGPDGCAEGAVIALQDLTTLAGMRERLEGAVDIERRRTAQLRALNQFAVTVNSETDPARILDEVLGTALRLTRSSEGAVYVPAGADVRLEVFVTIPELGESPHGGSASRMDLKEIAQRVAAGPMPVRMAADVAQGDGRFLGYLGVPLVTQGGGLLACVVVVGSPNQFGFTVEDEVLATTLAAHAGVALENLRRLAREREVAHYLQRAMLPRDIEVPGLVVDHVYESATDSALVGGDFYDVIPLADGRVALVVGDVCGKGLSAATFMSFARHTLKAQASADVDAGGWLDGANVILASDPETPSFVTVALTVIDTTDGTAELALAGHPGPLVAGDGGVVEIAGIHGLPLGVDPAIRYATTRFRIGPRDTLCLHTDGLLEARRGDTLFGEERLSRALAQAVSGPLQGSAARLVDEVTAFAGGRLVDDVVVLLARLTGETSRRRPRRAEA